MPEPHPRITDTGPALSSCEGEQIQYLGAVQAFGCLLVVSPEWTVRHVSANASEALLWTGDDLIGADLGALLPADTVHALRGKIQTLGGPEEGVRLFGLDLLGDGRHFDVAIHRSGDDYLLEFERKLDGGRRDDLALVQPLLSRIRQADSIEQMCEIATRGVLALTGFGRVMVYRFAPDQSGTVIAETRDPDMEGYLGLHFPATDIPPQARALYRRNLLRIIPDVNAPVFPVVPGRDPEGRPVDLSMAVTRAVSPIHIEYLRNMDVGASMSVSILRDGELWGLIACHHPRPLQVDYETRSALELFTQMLAYELHLRENSIERARADAARDLHDRLMALFDAGTSFAGGLGSIAAEISPVLEIDGMALIVGDRYCADGSAPDEDEFRALQDALAAQSSDRVACTDAIATLCPGVIDASRGIGGVMALSVRNAPRRYVMLFRREVAQNVVWAGNPAKIATDSGRISPRKSFAAWKETVRGKSTPWTAGDRLTGDVLRVTLLELLLKRTSDVSDEGRRRSQRQEILISELNHRLRNVFGLVGGIVARSGATEPTETALAGRLEGRIRALARANDQLTLASRDSFGLVGLIREEAAAFVGETGRLSFEGSDLHLAAAVRGTISLVIHELVTNSVKYGALGSPEGHVAVAIHLDDAGCARLSWHEGGGPPTRPPKRVGFGTTLITQSIPHELGGEALIDYRTEGLHARFVLPARHVESASPLEEVEEKAIPVSPAPRLSGAALVVEDNLVIAMNAAEALRALGATEVSIAGTVTEALARIEAHDYALAILDLDLGGDTSAAVAEKLLARGIPFLLATGYDARNEVGSVFAAAPMLAKPYSNDAIAAALAAL